MADDNTQHEHNTELPEGHGALAHQIHSDTFSVLGLTISLPGGIYTGVFLVLGILTALEVAIAEIFGAGPVKISALMGIAIAKAILVVIYYMHLKDDSRLFAVVVLLPLLITLLSILYLLAIPSSGYSL